MMALLVLTLLASSFFMVRTTIDQNLEHENQNGMDSHRIMVTSFHNNLMFFSGNQSSVPENIQQICMLTKGSGNIPFLLAADDTVIYNDTELEYQSELADTEHLNYVTIHDGGRTYISYYSCFINGGVKYCLVSFSDITQVIQDNNILRRRYFYMYLIIMIGGAVFSLLFSIHISRPVSRLTKASEKIAQGDYSARITKISHDELGKLSETYNTMAETIQEKIDDLELSVRRKEDFISAFAHETKTPMTGIIGYADLIYQGRLNEADTREAAGVIVSEGMRLQALSLKLLDIMTLDKENIRMEEINTTEMSQDLINSVRIRLEEKGSALECSLSDDYIYVDYDLFKTVLVNLIDNSAKANADKITIRGFRKDNSYLIEVADNGIGIPPSDLNRVKDAFYMVDKARSRKEHGAGLGLALADRIIRLHGGEMDIESTPGEGTTVRLTLYDRS